MATNANEVKANANEVIEANKESVVPVVENKEPEAKPFATQTDILSFVQSQVDKPSVASAAIDTSDIELYNYRTEDADINAVYTDAGWKRIRVIDENGETVPNARLEITHKDGNKYKFVPFFFAVLLARKSTIELTLSKQLKSFSEQGSMKARGNTHKFIMSQEQLEASQAKAQMQWEIDTKALAESFNAWLGSYHPTTDLLPVLFATFKAGTSLVSLGENQVFIRQTIPANSEVQPFDLPELPLVTTTPDKIGDILISTCYTYQLKTA